MNVIHWKRPELSRAGRFSNELDRLFDWPFGEFLQGSQFSGWVPALDLREDKDNVVVTVELPGMKKEDIEISLHEGNLTISGERKQEEKSEDAEVYRAERFTGRFNRVIGLPVAVATDKVKAQYKDGVLTITLPKTEEAKPRQIQVQAA